MVDNVAITAGTGTSVATDDVGGVHYQKVKLAIGASDTANLLSVGSGAIDTGTPRVTLATDDVLVGLIGTVADDSPLTVNGTPIGGRVETTQRTAMSADGDMVTWQMDGAGIGIVRPHTNLESIISGVAAITDGSSTSVIASPGSSPLRNYITTVIIDNLSAVKISVDIRDGAAGAVLATIPVPASGGFVGNFPVPLRFTAATAVCADPSTADDVTVTCLGFKAAL